MVPFVDPRLPTPFADVNRLEVIVRAPTAFRAATIEPPVFLCADGSNAIEQLAHLARKLFRADVALLHQLAKPFQGRW